MISQVMKLPPNFGSIMNTLIIHFKPYLKLNVIGLPCDICPENQKQIKRFPDLFLNRHSLYQNKFIIAIFRKALPINRVPVNLNVLCMTELYLILIT